MFKDSFEPIPSLDYLYEINARGDVRNVKTGRLLKARIQNRSKNVSVCVNGRYTRRSVSSLLHEAHGILPKRPPFQPIGTLIRKGYEVRTFNSIKKTAEFLAERLFYAVSTILKLLNKRRAEIHGWEIRYRKPEVRRPVTSAKANGDCELKRSAK